MTERSHLLLRTPIEFGRAIREARVQRGLTQAELADRARVSRRWIGILESGHSRAELGRALSVLRELDLAPTLVDSPRIIRNPLDDLIESGEW